MLRTASLLLAFALAACSHPNSGLDNGTDGGVLVDGGGGGDPSAPDFAELNTPAVCTSGTNWTGGDRGSSRMHPGVACIDCHDSTGGPFLSFAGTVFATAHEPDDCNGVSGGMQVVITGADGASTTITVGSGGNFYTSRSVALPFTAKVVSAGRERLMITPQQSGDCNSCHTQDGLMNAPGRIVAP